MNWPLLLNSLVVSGLTTLLATACGLTVALAASSWSGRWRQGLLLGAIATLALPPFLVTSVWIDLLGQQASWRAWLSWPSLRIYSLGGTVWLLALLTWPITTLFALGAWSRLEAGQLEIDPMARGWALFRRVLWPMARPALGQAAALTFVLALNNFAVPVILQVRVFPEELWLALTSRLDEAGAWTATLPMVAAALVLLWLCWRPAVAWPSRETPARAEAFRRQLGPRVVSLTSIGAGFLLLISVGLPLQRLGSTGRTWAELPNLFRAAPDTVWNSFWFAALTASLCVALGLVSWRLPAGQMLWLPFFVPGVLLGRTMMAVAEGTALYGTSALVISAFTLRYLAPAWNLVGLARRGVDPDLTDAARLEGARGWRLFRHVHWPQMASQLGAAWYVTYLLCLWDVETLVLIYPPGGETLALRSFNLLHYGHHAQVNALCLVLLALAGAPLAGWMIGRWLVRRRA